MKLAGAPDLDAATADLPAPWSTWKRTLTPRYGQVWGDITVCYAGLAAGVALPAALGLIAPRAAWGSVPLAAIVIGFFMSSLIRFMHEGAHFHLHPTPRWNDRLCDAFVCAWVFDAVAHYRKVHWQHHLHLGSPQDTEVSYTHPLTFGFLIRTLTAVYVFEVIGRRVLALRRATGEAVRGAQTPLAHRALAIARTALFQGAALGGAGLVAGWPGVVAWCLAMGSTYPFFDVLRQVLEHRRADLGPEVDLLVTHHGPHNRMFGTDPVSKLFGNAGFNLHMMHHWDPTISYTRLPDMEAYLLQTPLKVDIEAGRTTYLATLAALWRAGRGVTASAADPGPPAPD